MSCNISSDEAWERVYSVDFRDLVDYLNEYFVLPEDMSWGSTRYGEELYIKDLMGNVIWSTNRIDVWREIVSDHFQAYEDEVFEARDSWDEGHLDDFVVTALRVFLQDRRVSGFDYVNEVKMEPLTLFM